MRIPIAKPEQLNERPLYSDRRKFRMSCFSAAERALNREITALASDLQDSLRALESALSLQVLSRLIWASIAINMSLVRPSCKKKMRCPTPQSGAVRNSSPPAEL